MIKGSLQGLVLELPIEADGHDDGGDSQDTAYHQHHVFHNIHSNKVLRLVVTSCTCREEYVSFQFSFTEFNLYSSLENVTIRQIKLKFIYQSYSHLEH